MSYRIGLFALIVLLATSRAVLAQPPEPAATGPDCPIQLALANPAPGAVLVPLSVVINGTAVDQTATQGTGISQVQVFLGARDNGGVFLGNAVFSMTTDTPGFWMFQANFPDSAMGPAELFTYATSDVSGQVASVGVPILIGEDISQTGMEVTPSTPDISCPAAASGGTVANGMPIVNVQWQWTNTTDASGQSTSIDDPTMYTLMLQPNGIFQARADCNLSSGSFTQTETGVTFTQGPTTLAECPPGSLSTQYLSNLGRVNDYTVNEDGNLVLMFGDNGGQMLFAPATNAS
jgi:hypothetical protein